MYGTRAHVPDSMVMTNGTVYRLITDHLGSVRLVVNAATGAVVRRLDYAAFGRVLNDTSPGFQPFGFAGGLYDYDTGLVRFGARDYEAYAGRWTAKDPILFAGGVGLYAYAQNDPLNRIDPSGLDDKGCGGDAIDWEEILETIRDHLLVEVSFNLGIPTPLLPLGFGPGLSGSLTLTYSGIDYFVGGGLGVGGGLSASGGGFVGESSPGLAVQASASGSVVPPGTLGAGGTAAFSVTDAGGSASLSVGLGVGAGGTFTVGYSDTLVEFTE
ncbi:MAG: RHS repeat-associated core domain-containing protein [Myxococcales bacterium]|nr:RHS repeat-associated core domain-containing protein [Myxococcales bacterium]